MHTNEEPTMKRSSTWAEAVRELAVVVLVPALVLGTVPVSAAAAPAPQRDTRADAREAAPRPHAAPAPAVQVNRTRPRVEPAPSLPHLSTQATADELTRARLFSEPLLPLGGEPTQADSAALASALSVYLSRGGSDTTPLEALLDARGGGAWRASLWLNLGLTYKRQGRFTRAAAAFEAAWELAQDARDDAGRAVADQAIGELLALHTMFGREDGLAAGLAQIEGRELRGFAAEQALHAQHAAWGLQYRHHEATPSGPVALSQLLRVLGGGRWDDARLAAFHATPDGASLAEMQALAHEVGLRLKMVYREPGSEMIWPAMMHLRGSHFSAVVARIDGRYKLADPLLGGEVWWSPLALEEEASGYFLVPEDRPLPAGWRLATDAEAASVRGKCKYPEPHPNETSCSNNQSGGNGGNCSGPGCMGLATYSLHSLAVSVRVADTPVGYEAPVGPGVYFTVAYNQREAHQPGTFTYSNLGRRWGHEYLSYVEDDTTNPWKPVSVRLAGGGSEDHIGFDGQAYAPARRSRAVVRRVSSTPIVYERELPDGSKDVYAQSDGAVGTRRVFLTQKFDPQGNALTLTYDAQLRLVAITDAIGQVTTLAYEHPDPLKITRVTDPFGRSARFEYGPDGYLERITDVIGLVSEFEYGESDFMRALTTPYGTTRFRSGFEKIVSGGHVIAARWWVEATDPLGGKERLEFSDASTLPHMEPAASVPQGFHTLNKELNKRNSFYWDKRAMAAAGNGVPSYESAQVTHWLFEGTIKDPQHALIADTKHSEKRALEGRVWYDYIEEGAPQTQSTFDVPVKVARVLDDGSSQIQRYEYNDRGRVMRATDPVGRTTLYVYAPNGIDLLEVRQVNGTGMELLSSMTYSPTNPSHVPASVTDTAGQTTSYTYDNRGRVETVVTPARNGPTGTPLSLVERTTTYAYFPDDEPLGAARLRTITGPTTPQGAPVTSYTYDPSGRVRTTTDPDGHTLTYDYDALDRPTKVTYPDSTFEETVYSRLDAEKRRDRLGRWSHTFHDALRRVTMTRDALGRTITQVWCNCGSLDKLIDANGNTTVWERDLLGRVIKETRADGKTKDFVYETTTSRLKLVKDFMTPQQVKTYEYFIDDNLKRVTYSDAVVPTPSVSYTYDPVYDRPATMTDGIGTTTYAYHPIAVPPALGAGQLASVDGPLANDTVGYGYDELGRVATRGLSTFSSMFKYDALGRLAEQVSPVGSFTYQYDGVTGRRLGVTYPNGQTTAYTYFPTSADHRLQEIKHMAPGGGLLSRFNYSYDAVGNIKTWRQEHAPDPAQVYEFGYDRADQLTAATLRSTAVPPVMLKRYGYAYDPAGNRTTEQIDDVAKRSTHNNRNQLVTAQAGGALLFRGSVNEPVTVTVQGKPATVTAAPANEFEGAAQTTDGTTTVVVKATDPSGNTRTNTYQVTQAGTTTTYTYDANGNLTSDGTQAYEWDAENRLVRVCAAACNAGGTTDVARFTYDGEGRRQQKVADGVTRTYVHDETSIIEERVAGGATLRYVDGLNIDEHLAVLEGTAATYYVADHLGSIAHTTNNTGTVTLTRKYDPWGGILSGDATPGYAFTGRQWEPESHSYYYRARHYRSSMGRFVSEDSIGIKGDANFYAYVENSPTTTTDPLGLSGKWFDCGPRCQIRVERDPHKGLHAHWECKGGSSGCVKPDLSPCDNSGPPPQKIIDCLRRRKFWVPEREPTRQRTPIDDLARACRENPVACTFLVIAGILVCIFVPKPVPAI
jgi:RHS repeat-associated protein